MRLTERLVLGAVSWFRGDEPSAKGVSELCRTFLALRVVVRGNRAERLHCPSPVLTSLQPTRCLQASVAAFLHRSFPEAFDGLYTAQLSGAMGAEPPFLYDPPSKYTFAGVSDRGFNPKAVSQAAWAPKPPKPKPDGPLINSREFNRHPDSYISA